MDQLLDNVVAAERLLFSPANTANWLTDAPDDGLYFRAAPPDVLQAAALAQVIVRDQNQRVAILCNDDDYGLSIASDLYDRLIEAGMAEPDLSKTIYASESDYSEEVTALGGGLRGAPKLPWYAVAQLQLSGDGGMDLQSHAMAGRRGRVVVSWRNRKYDLGSLAVFHPTYRGAATFGCLQLCTTGDSARRLVRGWLATYSGSIGRQ